LKTVAAGGEHALVELIMATHAGMTTDAFAQVVKDWLATLKHPRFNRPSANMPTTVSLPLAVLTKPLTRPKRKAGQSWI
jgi:hypothetical protein